MAEWLKAPVLKTGEQQCFVGSNPTLSAKLMGIFDMSLLNSFFDKIICLNLDNRKDRWSECVTLFNKHNMVVERFPAIYGWDLNLPIENKADNYHGTMGCGLSHLFAIKYAKQLNLKNVLVLEDDVDFIENLDSSFQDVLRELPQNWDMLYLGGNHRHTPIKYSNHLYKITGTVAVHAIGVNSSVFDAAIKSLTNIDLPADDNYVDIQQKYNVFVTKPHLVWQKTGKSSILKEKIDYSFMEKFPDIDESESSFISAEKPKVILSMSTVPNRLMEEREGWATKECLKTLMNLSYDNYEIHFNIPRYSVATGETYKIPKWLTYLEGSKLKIFRTEDHGPITKIAPTISRIDDPNAIIITVDDDLSYEDGFIEYHLKKREQYPNAVIGFAGIDSLDGTGTRFVTSVKNDTRVKVIEGYKTVSYLRSFFKEDFFTEFVGKHWADDIVLSAYVGKYNIPKIVVAHDKETNYTPRVDSFPVIDHLPIESGGCNIFRQKNLLEYEESEKLFYKLGYLER